MNMENEKMVNEVKTAKNKAKPAGLEAVRAEVETPKKRPYTRRSKEEIQAEKEEKERRKAMREAAKMVKLEPKATKAKKAKASEKVSDEVEDEEDSDKGTSKKPAKRGSNGQKPIMPPRGAWSVPSESLATEKLYVEVELLEPALGTSPSDKELLDRYIISKAPDAISKEEEIAAIGEEQVAKNGTTIFMNGWFKVSPNNQHFIDVLDRFEGGGRIDKSSDMQLPFFWNYQIRGFFKDSCGLLSRGSYGESANLKAYKKVIDGGIFVHPRRLAIDLPEVGYDDEGNEYDVDPLKLPVLQRPLRIQDRNGERTAIASSEMIPAGSRLKFCICYTDPKFRDVIIEWLNYGSEHGLGAWRNSGRGAFRWRELNSDWSPITSENSDAE